MYTQVEGCVSDDSDIDAKLPQTESKLTTSDNSSEVVYTKYIDHFIST